MALRYKIIARRDPQTGEVLYFPTLVLSKSIASYEEIANLIAKMSSVTPGDCFDVLMTLPDALHVFLGDGRPCELYGLGHLVPYIKASGYGKRTPEEVTTSSIKNVLIRFFAKKKKQGLHFVTPLTEGFEFELDTSVPSSLLERFHEAEGILKAARQALKSAQHAYDRLKIRADKGDTHAVAALPAIEALLETDKLACQEAQTAFDELEGAVSKNLQENNGGEDFHFEDEEDATNE